METAAKAPQQPAASAATQPESGTKRALDGDKENSLPKPKWPRQAKSATRGSLDNSKSTSQADPAPPQGAGANSLTVGTCKRNQRQLGRNAAPGAAAQVTPSTSIEVGASSGSDSGEAGAPTFSNDAAAAEVVGLAVAAPPAQRKGRTRMPASKTVNGAAPKLKAVKQQQRHKKAPAAEAATKQKQRNSKKADALAALQGSTAAHGAASSPLPPAAAAASGGSSKGMTKQQRSSQAIIGYEPARVLAAAYAVAAAKYTSSISQEEVEQAEPVVTNDDGVPLWEMDDQSVEVVKEDKHLHLSKTATQFAAGRQPYKAFVQQNIEALIEAVGDKTAEELAGDAAATAAADAAAARVLAVMEQPFDDSGAQLATAVMQAHREFWKTFRLAKVTEAERVERTKEETKKKKEAGNEEKAKNPSARPDRVAESLLLTQQFKAVNDRDSFGHVPGVPVNHMFDLRSEMSVLGVHKSPLGGIVTADIPVPIEVNGKTYKGVRAATSICMSGCYEDDHDSTSSIITYTGEGGNDLLGNKKQVKGQQLERGNKALMANIALGIPVRLFRRNSDDKAAMNSVLFYDGLYDVVSWIKTLGKEGKVVYIFGLKRRVGQPPSLSKPIARFKESTANRRGNHTRVRENIIVKDISKGLEKLPVVVHNEVDRTLPPGIDPIADKKWIVDDRADTAGPLLPDSDKHSFKYIVANVYDEGVPAPQPPTVVLEGSAEAVAAQQVEAANGAQDGGGGGSGQPSDAAATTAAESEVIIEFSAAAVAAASSAGSRLRRNKSSGITSNWVASRDLVIKRPDESPHDLLARLNSGKLPYGGIVHRSQQKGDKEKDNIAGARELSRVLVECGDWTGCTDPNCEQRQVYRGLRYHLEVFKTLSKGWAVRSWDLVRSGTLVCIMWGMLMRAEDVGEGRKYSDSDYFFDVHPRQELELGAELFRERNREPKYILDAKEQGGVARFINHSCNPNLYVQPLCVGHTDVDMVLIGLFAGCDIRPFTELTYDYGSEYVEKQLCGVCLCAADCCKYKPQQQQQVEDVAPQ